VDPDYQTTYEINSNRNFVSPLDGNVQLVFDVITELLNSVENKSKYEILLIRNFNADYRATKQPSARIIRPFAAEHTLTQIIKPPTRYSQTASIIIDMAFTNIKYCIASGVIN
jgi:hypothetical protein